MLKIVCLCLILTPCVFAANRRCTNDCTELDDYVWREDNYWSYETIAEYPMDGYTTYILNMTSQKWMNESITSRSIWWHYLGVHIPDTITHTDAAFLYISTGSNTDSPPTATSNNHIARTGVFSNETGIVSAALRMVPNQRMFLYLNNTVFDKSEDGIIAFTWRTYIDEVRDNDMQLGADFLLRCPMSKATVRAMDTIADFVKEKLGEQNDIQKFMLGGESKRGWTTWTTAATDKRVVAQAPAVLSCLNVRANFHHYYRSLGNWSFALGNYWFEGLMGRIDDPETIDLERIIDPYAYRHRYTIPTLVINGASDEFFMNDDHHYWWNDMPAGYFWLWMMENTRHSISRSPLVEEYWHTLASFYLSVLEDYARPELSWTRNETETHGTITVTSSITPKRISSFTATTPDNTRRDFRVAYGFPIVEERNVTWTEEPVEDLGGNRYSVTFETPTPDIGWRGFFIKMVFDGPNGRELFFSTEAMIIPDVFPYPKCEGFEQCQGDLV